MIGRVTRAMKCKLELLAATAVVIPALLGVALALTGAANRLNVVGLGWFALLTWILLAMAALLLIRRGLPRPMWVAVPLGWFTLAVFVYQYVGYYCFGWGGLLKP